MDMYKWLKDILSRKNKGTLPILSFPSVSLLGTKVSDLIRNADLQARGMKAISDRCDTIAAVSLMDLSVEAEAFGSEIRTSENEVPTVVGAVVTSLEDAEKIKIPEVGTARTGIYIDAIKKACELITDRPVFAGVIGPYSLGGRLMDVSEIMINCYVEPETVHATLIKTTDFLIEYIKAYKKAGASGVIMAEPLTGMLSPSLAEEFSEPYVKKIVDAVQDESFIVIYHNCGDNTVQMIDSILRTGSAAYHFGDAINMADMLLHIPQDTLVMGNVSPSRYFVNGSPESIADETKKILSECSGYDNFVISSGCDIPPLAPWENIDAYFSAVKAFYVSE